MARKSGLGKGLGALIPSQEKGGEAPSGLSQIQVASIRPNSRQPRQHFDEEALTELADSIRTVGLLQPVLVRPVGDGFELIAGERRWRAARRAGLQAVPALVRNGEEEHSLAEALIENVHRADLNALEEAAAYQQLIEDFGLTHDEVAQRVGKSRAAVSNALRLLQLPPSIQRYVREGKLSMGHARAVLGTPDRAFQESLARRVVEEGLSVRMVEDAVRDHSPKQKTTVPSGTRLRPAGLLELEELLGDFLETRVRVQMGGKKGRIVVEFSNLEDLERIYRAMAGDQEVALK